MACRDRLGRSISEGDDVTGRATRKAPVRTEPHPTSARPPPIDLFLLSSPFRFLMMNKTWLGRRAVIGRSPASVNLFTLAVWWGTPTRRYVSAYRSVTSQAGQRGKPRFRRSLNLPAISFGQGIFIDYAVLHNDQKVFLGVCDKFNIFQRITIHQQQICECALFHHTKLAGIGVDKPG
jgi:hypothetical protein